MRWIDFVPSRKIGRGDENDEANPQTLGNSKADSSEIAVPILSTFPSALLRAFSSTPPRHCHQRRWR
jgi:hypothetical protein